VSNWEGQQLSKWTGQNLVREQVHCSNCRSILLPRHTVPLHVCSIFAAWPTGCPHVVHEAGAVGVVGHHGNPAKAVLAPLLPAVHKQQATEKQAGYDGQLSATQPSTGKLSAGNFQAF